MCVFVCVLYFLSICRVSSRLSCQPEHKSERNNSTILQKSRMPARYLGLETAVFISTPPPPHLSLFLFLVLPLSLFCFFSLFLCVVAFFIYMFIFKFSCTLLEIIR